MSFDAPAGAEALPVDAAQRIDRICDRFETAWKEGQRPEVEAFIEGASEPDRTVLLCELIALDLSYRRQSKSDEPTYDEYVRRFPAHCNALRLVFASDKTGYERMQVELAVEQGLLRRAQRRYIDSIASLRRAAGIRPDDGQVQRELARSYLAARMLAQASQAAAKAEALGAPLTDAEKKQLAARSGGKE